MTASGIKETLDYYRRGAASAKEAGFDGVEIHAANGYLIGQFLKSGSNRRTDEYGGVALNRVRFLTETVERVLKVWESSHVDVRISTTDDFNAMTDDNPVDTFSVAIARFNGYGLGYIQRLRVMVAIRPSKHGANDVSIIGFAISGPCRAGVAMMVSDRPSSKETTADAHGASPFALPPSRIASLMVVKTVFAWGRKARPLLSGLSACSSWLSSARAHLRRPHHPDGCNK